MKKKNLAFTLAEVLIVIGIIGVVAALTLPNLNHATGDKEKVTKVKKIYSALTEAIDRAQVIYGGYDTWFNDLGDEDENAKSERFAKRVTEFMKVSKDCGFEDGCWANGPLLDLDGVVSVDDYFSDLSGGYFVVLQDGTSIYFYANDSFAKIRADIDGPNKGKTQSGNDIFDFSIFTDEELATVNGANVNQLYPSSNPIDWTGSLCENSSASYKENYATAWVIENGNLDYLKCYDELNWETKTSCE